MMINHKFVVSGKKPQQPTGSLFMEHFPTLLTSVASVAGCGVKRSSKAALRDILSPFMMQFSKHVVWGVGLKVSVASWEHINVQGR